MDTQQDSTSNTAEGNRETVGLSEDLEILLVNSTFTLIFLSLLLFLILGIYDHSIIPILTR